MRWYLACAVALCLAATGCMMDAGDAGEEAWDPAASEGSRSIVRVDDVEDEAPTAQPMSLETESAWVFPDDEGEGEVLPSPEDLGHLTPDDPVQRVQRPEPVPWKDEKEPVEDAPGRSRN